MPQTTRVQRKYEYAPIHTAYRKIGLGYGFAEGAGINASGGLRGFVVIHEHSTNEVFVSVFSDTAVRKLAGLNSFRQATVTVTKDGKELAGKVVDKSSSYGIAESSHDIYLGSATLSLPPPVDMRPAQVFVTAVSSGMFSDSVVPGRTQHVVISLAVREVIAS